VKDLIASITGATPWQRLASLRDAVDGRIVFTTSFGLEDQALAHMIFDASLAIEVVTIDTGRLFPATYKLWADTEDRYARRIHAFYPNAEAVAGFVGDWGINGFYHATEARSACCGVRKVEPLARALAGAAGWVTGMRADQSQARGAVPLATRSMRRDSSRSAASPAPAPSPRASPSAPGAGGGKATNPRSAGFTSAPTASSSAPRSRHDRARP